MENTAQAETRSKNIVTLENVSKIYKMGEVEIFALKNVNLEIKNGEFVAVLGPSGSGKTTLLNLLGGIDTPSSGKIFIDDEDISYFSQRKLTLLRREKIGFVFQFFNLIPTLSARENVEYAIELASRDKVLPEHDAPGLLSMVGLKDRMNHFPYQLSGGEQQRVAVARALAKDPVLVLGDEPTGNLDFRTGKLVLKTLEEIHSVHGRTVILVTHNSPIAKVANKIIRLHDGEVAEVVINENPTPIDEVEW